MGAWLFKQTTRGDLKHTHIRRRRQADLTMLERSQLLLVLLAVMALSATAFRWQGLQAAGRQRGLVAMAAATTATAAVPLKLNPVAPTGNVRLTFLESNSWLWQVRGVVNSWLWQAAGLNLLVDPVMYTLDFGVPALIQGKKKVVDGQAALRAIAPSVDYVLISQGFDDHCQPASMAEAARLLPRDAKVVAPPSAGGVLEKYFPAERIIYLSPGQSAELKGRKDGKSRVKITATTGDTLGPPWQAPENGYVLQFLGAAGGSGKPRSLYYEPHCRYNVEEFAALGLSADVVVTPVIEQLIMGAYPLVAGQRKAAELARALKAKVVVPMNNGDINLGGLLPLDRMIKKSGTMAEFQRFLQEVCPSASVKEAPPGEAVTI